jgi:hypothetical protein
MNRFNFGSETPNRAAILAGGRRASQHSCKSSSSAVAGSHGLKVRGIALDPRFSAYRPKPKSKPARKRKRKARKLLKVVSR